VNKFKGMSTDNFSTTVLLDTRKLCGPAPRASQSELRSSGPVTKPHKVISLFSGIGGMDMGFGGNVIVHEDSVAVKEWIDSPHTIDNFVKLKPTNFQIVFQNDILKGAKEVCVLNQTDFNYNTQSIYDLIKNNYQFPSGDVVIGGFPCQDFSHCGKREGFESNKAHDLKSTLNESKDNNRGTLYKCFVEVVKRTQPKIFVAENVYGLLTMKNNPIELIIKDFSDLGFDVKYQVFNCLEHGIHKPGKG